MTLERLAQWVAEEEIVELILGDPATLKKHALDSHYVRACLAPTTVMTWWCI
jgi:hypothetical protein